MGYLLAALLGGFLAFNSAATPHKVASVAQSALQKQYPTGRVAVQIEGKRGASVLKGRFKLVRVSLADVTLADLPMAASRDAKKIGKAGLLQIDLQRIKWGDLPIESAQFRFSGVDYDFDALKKQSQFQIVRMGPSQMNVQLRGEMLHDLFAARLKDIENPQVHLQGDQLLITGERTVLGLKTPVELTASLIGVGPEVRMSNPQIKVGGVTIPAAATASLTKDVGSLYTFDRDGKWPFVVDIQRVTAQNEMLGILSNLTLKP